MHKYNKRVSWNKRGQYANIQSQEISLIRRQEQNKCRIKRASLEDCDRGKSLGRIDGCSCSSRYHRFFNTRQRWRRCACIRDFIQPCEGPSIAGGGTNGTSAGGPGPSPNTTTLHHITQRTPARTYYPFRWHRLGYDTRSTIHFTFYTLSLQMENWII